MSQREIRIGFDRLVQALRGAGPGREQQGYAMSVAFGREVGRRREWQAAAVEVAHGRSTNVGSRVGDPTYR